MKNFYFYSFVLLVIFMLTLPFLALHDNSSNTAPLPNNQALTADTVVLLETESGQLKTLPMRDYLFGVVAAEMSLSHEEETLKAQAIASYTYTLYKKEKNKGEKHDITDNHSTDQAYLSKEKIMEKWGDKASEYEKKLNEVLDAVSGIYISYKNAPIYAAYHAISSGKTESSESVFGNALPYLVETESMGDLLCTDYLTEQIVSAEDFYTAFKDLCTLPTDNSKYIGNITRSSSGGAKTITVGDKAFSGGDFRRALSLRSTNFDVTFKDGAYHFTVRGYGHGVGMSQNGAEYMAAQGSTYVEILNWYYKGCELKTLK